MNDYDNSIVEFCKFVKKGSGVIVDSNVKSEFESMYELANSYHHGKLLAVLELNNLLDKKNSVNNDPLFYRNMFKQFKAQSVNEGEAKNFIKSEAFWRERIDKGSYAEKILNAIFKRKKKGYATDREMQVLNKALAGDKTPYHPKN